MAGGRPILIVGAGPTGLTLAIALRKKGLPVRIVDILERGQNTSRAVAIHARTLEVLEPLGVTPLLLARGNPVAQFSVRSRERKLAGISFEGLPSAYPYILLVPQAITEECLEQRLAELGGVVERGTEYLSSQAIDGGLVVELRGKSGREKVSVSYLVGTDGMHSKVRGAAGIAFHGAAYEESFVLADVAMNWPYGASEGTVLIGKDGLALVVPLPKERYRIVATLNDAPAMPDAATMQALMDARGPAGVKIQDVKWSSRFRVHHRLAGAFLKGRVIVLGDAAHVHSPAGGQGMNLGIRDAVALASALAAGDRVSVERWARRRKGAAKRVIRNTDRFTRLGIRRGRGFWLLRNAGLRLVSRVPGLLPAIAKNLAGLWDRAR